MFGRCCHGLGGLKVEKVEGQATKMIEVVVRFRVMAGPKAVNDVEK